MFVPHGVRADGSVAQVLEDSGPAGVADEGGVVSNLELVGEEAEVVDVSFVWAGLTNGANENKFGFWF